MTGKYPTFVFYMSLLGFAGFRALAAYPPNYEIGVIGQVACGMICGMFIIVRNIHNIHLQYKKKTDTILLQHQKELDMYALV